MAAGYSDQGLLRGVWHATCDIRHWRSTDNPLCIGSADLRRSVQSGFIKGERGSAITITEPTEGLISVPRAAVLVGHSIPCTQRLIGSANIEGQKVGWHWLTTEEAITHN